MNNSSEYFSLLFPTEEQEEASKKRSDVRVCYRRKLPVQKAYKMIGSRMVLEIEMESCAGAAYGCFGIAFVRARAWKIL